MIDYFRRVVYSYLGGRCGAMVMDSFRAHFVEEVSDYMKEIRTKALAITAGFTPELQPLDAVVNKPFKDYMKREWDIFIAEPTTASDFTKANNRKKPSYERILSMVSNSVHRLNSNPNMLRKVFKGFKLMTTIRVLSLLFFKGIYLLRFCI